jgi:DNA-binding XRE family transcriptional regulator
MTFEQWRIERHMPIAEAARELGITRQALWRMCRGIMRPSLETAVAIERLTEGKVPPSSWLTAA